MQLRTKILEDKALKYKEKIGIAESDISHQTAKEVVLSDDY